MDIYPRYPTASGGISPEYRQRILRQSVVYAISQGGRLQWADDFSAVMIYGKPVNHLLHFIITLFFIAWLFVWIILAMTGGERREVIWVDEWGRIGIHPI